MEHSFSFYKTENYAIIGAKYEGTEYKPALVKQSRQAAIDRLNEKLSKARKENMIYFEPQNVLILWENFQDESYLTKKLGHANDNLIMEFCDRINRASKKRAVQLFIDEPKTLFEEGKSIFLILERLVYIWEETNLIPVLLEKDFLSIDNKNLMGKEHWREEWKNASSFVESLKIAHTAKDRARQEKEEYLENVRSYYEHFFMSIKTLIKIFTPEEKRIRKKQYKIEKSYTEFIHTYFMWQSGIYTSVEEAQEEMGENIPISTWYRYVDRFENNIMYEEYTVAYWDYLYLEYEEMKAQNPSYQRDHYTCRPKKGNTPDMVEYTCFFNREERLSFFNPQYELRDAYWEFDEIHSLIDVERAKVTAQIQLNNLMNRKTGSNSSNTEVHYGKKLIKEKLEKYGYEEDDLYSIFTKKSSYYNMTQETMFDFDEIDSVVAEIEREADIPEEREWKASLEESDG